MPRTYVRTRVKPGTSGKMSAVKPWAVPAAIAAFAVLIVGGFLTVGPGLGLAMGAAAVGSVVVWAARSIDQSHIETLPGGDLRRRVLVVALAELDDKAVEAIRVEGEFDQLGSETDVHVLAPATGSQLDRWAMDLDGLRADAQRRLVISVAALGKADIRATANVGDPDLSLAVEDALRSFAATEVILAAKAAGLSRSAEREVAALEERLRQPMSRIDVG